MMRKVLISTAVAASALAVAAPASAQMYPPPPPPPGYAYGYNSPNNYGQVRRLQARIDMLQRHIRELDRRGIITNREARSLRDESRAIEFRLRETSRFGLNWREQQAVQVRISRLERRIQKEATDGPRRRYGYNPYGWGQNPYGYDPYGYNGTWMDRDRDGRNDRYEDDRGYRHD